MFLFCFWKIELFLYFLYRILSNPLSIGLHRKSTDSKIWCTRNWRYLAAYPSCFIISPILPLPEILLVTGLKDKWDFGTFTWIFLNFWWYHWIPSSGEENKKIQIWLIILTLLTIELLFGLAENVLTPLVRAIHHFVFDSKRIAAQKFDILRRKAGQYLLTSEHERMIFAT